MSPERKVQPIKPQEVAELKLKTMPDEAIEAVNELLAEKGGTGGHVTLLQKDIVRRMVQKGLKESDIYKFGWLDFENSYRKAGWKVTYDKPGYNESYDANFSFSPKRAGYSDDD